MIAAKAPFDNDESLKCQFTTLCLEVSEMAHSIGVDIMPFFDRSLPHFSKLELPGKVLALKNLTTYHSICAASVRAGNSLQESKSLIWFAIKAFGLRPTSDLFNFIQDDHVIEIHDKFGVQIFRNFQFYKFCSYSIEELYCISWPELFSHEGSVTQQIMEKGMLLLSGKIKSTIPFDIHDHEIRESSSICKFHIRANVELGSPLFNQESNLPEATIVLERGKLLNPENRTRLQNIMPHHQHLSVT